VGTVAAGVSKAKADSVLISGCDGGTGASPLSSIRYAGLPWEIGLAEVHQTLVWYDLRDRITVQVDGQMRTGRDVAIAALLGAEEFGFGSAALVALGCDMIRKCHQNNCPVGIATQDPRCRKSFTGKPEYLINYFLMIAEELREIMASLGFRRLDEMTGRADFLTISPGISHWKARTLDFSNLFTILQSKNLFANSSNRDRNKPEIVLDHEIIAQCSSAIDIKQKVTLNFNIRNTDRATGTMLSNMIVKTHGSKGLDDDTIKLKFEGSAGQSFGAWASRGMTMLLEGDANDYVGKGLSGGKIIVKVPQRCEFDPAENVIIGNVALYGATSGEAYFNGLAGERFAIRNSGALAVVEGVGDHGCEYMTGGIVVVLGKSGVNFAAGMSGGIAYVYDPLQDFDLRCNLVMVDLDPLTDKEDIILLKRMIEQHLEYTNSNRASWMLENWTSVVPLFVKVMPVEYRRALGRTAEIELNARRTDEETIKRA
jgi:glutamate synthase domain-containing protein 3